MRKPKAKRTLGQPAPSSPAKKPRVTNYVHTPLTTQGIDELADLTDGNCGLVKLMRKPVQQRKKSQRK